MTNVQRIALFTFGRSDFGLLRNLVLELEKNEKLEVIVVAAGSHFLEKFGNSIEDVRRDKFTNLIEIDCVSGSSEALEIIQDMARSLSEFGKALELIAPDLIVILGDRFEALTAASAALLLRIPIAHINGGELTVGAFDDAIRHSITKMSSIHFVANEIYDARVLQLGEQTETVHNVGHLAADSFAALEPMTQAELEQKLGFQFKPYNFLVTLHPETASTVTPEELVRNLLLALENFPEAGIIFTSPNPDPGHATISQHIEKFVVSRENAVSLEALGHRAYLSAMLMNTVVVGNSSSGVLEAPIIGVPSVDIGTRQKGRVISQSIKHSNVNSSEIQLALTESLVKLGKKHRALNFKDKSESVSGKISHIISNLKLSEISEKSFRDA